MTHSKDICETLGSTMCWYVNFTFKLTKKLFLGRIWQFGPNLDQYCLSLYLMI